MATKNKIKTQGRWTCTKCAKDTNKIYPFGLTKRYCEKCYLKMSETGVIE